MIVSYNVAFQGINSGDNEKRVDNPVAICVPRCVGKLEAYPGPSVVVPQPRPGPIRTTLLSYVRISYIFQSASERSYLYASTSRLGASSVLLIIATASFIYISRSCYLRLEMHCHRTL